MKLFLLLICSIYVYCRAHLAQFAFDDQDSDDLYPNYIPEYPVRRDRKTNETVSRGRFEILNRRPRDYENNPKKKVTLAKFKEVLQCAAKEPSLNGLRGIMDILAMLSPTTKILERVCQYVDTGCDWHACDEFHEKSRKAARCRAARPYINMLRVMNGSVFLDWGYCIFNPTTSFPYESMTIPLFHVLDMISDMPDSVFMVGAEQSSLPWRIPFPLVSNSPDFHTAEIPWPWIESMKTEFDLYGAAADAKDFSESNYRKKFVQHYLPWSHRHPKAAYFGEMIHIRQIFFDQALIRPDLIEARWKCDFCGTPPWNPTSNERWSFQSNADTHPKIFYSRNQSHSYTLDRSKIGYLDPLKHIRITESTNLHVGKYKYVAVLTGINAKASSGRLASLLAYSGAVVMLQHSEFEYHFSARLKPWVHYVPLTYSAADIVNKVEWLKEHDEMAQQIATNGRNFGLSYLRLEDQYCYVASALEKFAEIFKGSSALKPFEPTPIPYRYARRATEDEDVFEN